VFYLRGRWRATAEYCELEGMQGSILLRFSAAGANLVMSCEDEGQVEILLDKHSLVPGHGTPETLFENGHSYVHVDRPRMYSLLEEPEFGSRVLELRCPPGLRAYAFTFTSCVDPVASGATASQDAR
jgi:hypothetical protein